jgi:hypothetical protein
MLSRLVPLCLDAVLALGVLLALDTQFRIGDVIGPGELLMAVWVIPAAGIALSCDLRKAPPAFLRIIVFWALFAAALCVGTIFTIASSAPTDWALTIHDAEAYLILIVVTGLLTLAPDAPARLTRVQWIIVLAGFALLLLELANALGLYTIPNEDPWYWNRMRGWSDNPNQFALSCLLIGFLALALAERERGAVRRSIAFVSALGALGIGLLAKSNAYTGVVIAALLVFAIAKAIRALASAERKGFPLGALAAASLAALTLSAVVLVPAIGLPAHVVSSLSQTARSDEGEAETMDVRLDVWANTIQRGGESWMLGFGPGPHLAIPTSILTGRRDANEPINLVHPKQGLAPNFEAHNTLLEVFIQGGILAAGAFVWITATGAWRSLSSGMDGTLALLFALAVFGSFHVIFRHPIVWFVICQALTGDRRADGPYRVREGCGESAAVRGVARRTFPTSRLVARCSGGAQP